MVRTKDKTNTRLISTKSRTGSYLRARHKGPHCFWLLHCFIVLAIAIGCKEKGNHLPSPLRDDFPYEIEFRSSKVWEPDNFELNLNGVLHRIVLASIEPPPPGNPQRQIAIDTLRDLVGNADGRAVVQDRDRFEREIAKVFASPNSTNQLRPAPSPGQNQDPLIDLDVGLRLIELGLARCSPNQLNHSSEYQQAETTARMQQKGIWNSD